MEYVPLGKTGLSVSRTSFGALPIQRVALDDARKLLCKAYDAGINFYDTARGYTDSEEKLGEALSGVRSHIIIATKSHMTEPRKLRENLETSLRLLKTDYVDLFQFHNPRELPSDEIFEACMAFKREGKIRFLGVTNHSVEAAGRFIDSGQYDSLQFPFSCLSDEKDLELAARCEKTGMGFIAMKAMGGGLIRNVGANFAFIRRYPHVVPIWGIQRESELDEFLALENNPPFYTADMEQAIEKERSELTGKYCRACGYCKPCEADIPLDMACRMDLFLNRGVPDGLVTEEWQELMGRIEKCTKCGACAARCPYGLVPYELLPYQLSYYRQFVKDFPKNKSKA